MQWFFGRGAGLAPVVALAATIGIGGSAMAGQAAVDEVQRAAYSGDYRGGVEKLRALAAAEPSDGDAQFGLGGLEFLQALAKLQESLWKHSTPGAPASASAAMAAGVLIGSGFAGAGPSLVPLNPNATPMTYRELRRILAEFASDLQKAEASLAKVGDRPAKIPLEIGRIAFDFNHDGQIGSGEQLFAGGRLGPGAAATQTVIHFDTADASWLRGYANVLMATTNLLLAVDFEATYEVAGHLAYGSAATAFGRELEAERRNGRKLEAIQADILALDGKIAAFGTVPPGKPRLDEIQARLRELSPRPQPPATAQPGLPPVVLSQEAAKERVALTEEMRRIQQASNAWYRDRSQLQLQRLRLVEESQGLPPGGQAAGIMDLIAMVHTLDWPVVEPERLKAVRRHLVAVMDINRETWRLARAETDDDHEWLPNARQTAPLGQAAVTDEMIDGWLRTTALVKDVLEGKKLLPHPHFRRGVNLGRIFETSKRIDLVTMAPGHGLLPYLEDGPTVDAQAWSEVTRPLGQNFWLYALWFN